MQTQRTELLKLLPKHGWRLTSVEEDNLEWWADETWLLESVWSPVGSHAYITFLVDPQVTNGRSRKKGTSVWAVKASLGKPVTWLTGDGEATLSLGQGWKEEIPDFFVQLAVLRSQNKESSSLQAAPERPDDP